MAIRNDNIRNSLHLRELLSSCHLCKRSIVITAIKYLTFCLTLILLCNPIIATETLPQRIFSTDQLTTSEVKVLLNEGYHNTTEKLSLVINRFTQGYPKIFESFIIGDSVAQNPLFVLKISSRNITSNSKPRPGVALLGGIHGDHASGHELVLYLAAFLLESYGKTSRITNLINYADIYFIPTLNPDGFQSAHEGDCNSAKVQSGRKNANGIDLDLDFRFHNHDMNHIVANDKLQPESKSFVQWILAGGSNIQLFATLRTGLTGITYPYDELSNQLTEHTYGISANSITPNAAPDKLLFEYLGHQVYYKFQQEPTNSKCTPISNNVTVLDGAQVSSTYGTLSDFLYRFINVFPINIYLDCCKYPRKENLESIWLQHSNSLFAFMESIKLGVRGTITDRVTSKPVENATIWIQGFGKNITTDASGFFWRPLLPGHTYDVRVNAGGYIMAERSKIIGPDLDYSSGTVNSIVLNVKLISNANQHKNQAISDDAQAKFPGITEESENVFVASKLKPMSLYKNVDMQIAKLDFKTPTDLQTHHDQQQVENILRELNRRFPKISRMYNIGKSTEGHVLWVLEISDKPGVHQLLKPEFRYIGNIHGNEVVGRELILHLAKLMLENYGTNEFVTALVNSTRIHLLPTMNPDGYAQASEGDCESGFGRGNANGKDLNRNFPDRYNRSENNGKVEVEVEAIMKWSIEHPFVLGANLHGGSLVANYPFDGNENSRDKEYAASPDDKLFIHLAKAYSTNHASMSKGEHCYDICGNDKTSLLNERFKDGITNGAQWYVLYGGIQDWVYLNTNCMSITVELGCMKYPWAKDMPKYWSDNKSPLLKYILEAHKGIYGIVTDQRGKALSNATIHVRGIDRDVHSAESGDYWRILLPGDYFVSVSKEGYRTAHRTVTLGSHKVGLLSKRVDFSLSSGPKDLSVSELGSTMEPSVGIVDNADIDRDPMSSIDEIHPSERPKFIPNRQEQQHLAHESPQHKASTNNSLTINGAGLAPATEDTRFMLALCFIIVLPSIMLLVYLFGSTDSKRYPSKLGFYRLATTAPDDLDGDDDDNEGTRFMKRTSKVNASGEPGSDSEDELYCADNWDK